MKVSVIIPVYNSVKYLDDCVSSIVKQTVNDWECILIDDGSTDGSGQKCDDWAEKDKRIRVIHQKNGGVSIARNAGLEKACGSFLYFLDSDDWCEPNIFQMVGDYDMVLGQYYRGSSPMVHSCDIEDNIPYAYLNDQIRVCMGSFIVKTEIVKDNAIRFERGRKYAEDLSFILRCLLKSRKVMIKRNFFMHYRMVATSAVHNVTLDYYDAYFSRLWLVNDVLNCENNSVVTHLHHYACAESVIMVTRELFARGYSVQRVENFFKKHPSIKITLIRARLNTTLRTDYRRIASELLYCPWLYKLEICFLFSLYDFRAIVGRLKRKVYAIVHS